MLTHLAYLLTQRKKQPPAAWLGRATGREPYPLAECVSPAGGFLFRRCRMFTPSNPFYQLEEPVFRALCQHQLMKCQKP
jgi:hypothetical protein